MDVEMPKGRSFQKGFELQIYEDDLDRLEQVSLFTACKRWPSSFTHLVVSGGLWLFLSLQMEDSEGTVRQIGAFSEGIQNLTVRLRGRSFTLLRGDCWTSIFFPLLLFTRAC